MTASTASGPPIVLSIACLCHGIVLIYTVVAALVIVLCRCGADLWRSIRRRTDATRRRVRRRIFVAAVIGLFTVLFSAFWVGPFLFNHDYMTDMKYRFRPDARIYRATRSGTCSSTRSWRSTSVINGARVHRVPRRLARRHVYGVALGLTTLAAVALPTRPTTACRCIGLLWNPRVLPLVYLMRYLLDDGRGGGGRRRGRQRRSATARLRARRSAWWRGLGA